MKSADDGAGGFVSESYRGICSGWSRMKGDEVWNEPL